MNRIAALLLACVSLATAESNLGAPVVGMARDSQDRLRALYGVAGSFVLREPIADKVLDWAFDGKDGLVKTDSELLALDASGKVIGRRAARGDAVISAGAAFFPATGELWLIGAHPDRKISIERNALGGDVVALGIPDTQSAPLAVCRANRVWLVTVDVASGAVTRETLAPGAIGDQACAGALVWLEGNFLMATARGLIMQSPGSEVHKLPIAGGDHSTKRDIHRAGERWVQVESTGASPVLVLVTIDGGKVYRLPAMGARP